MTLAGERDVLDRWASGKTAGELADYRAQNNAVSIDGLPALTQPGLTEPAPDEAPALAVSRPRQA
jgi:hypothetical protein